MDKKKLLLIIFSAVIVIVSVILRVLYLNSSLWYDEACSWFTAKQDFPFGIMDNLLNLDLQHTPLYFFILHFWMKIFGNGEIAIKSLSLVFSLLTLPLAYIVTNKLTKDRLISTSILLITSVSPIITYFSTEARMYPMAMFLVLLSINFLIDFEEKKDNKTLVKLGITNVMLPYTLVGGIFYNLSLMYFYARYLKQASQEAFKMYKSEIIGEIAALIPYFILVIYYAKLRVNFVIKHEGFLQLATIVETIQNFFGTWTKTNVYWSEAQPELITLSLAIFIITPCVYFLTGIISGRKNSTGFLKVLYDIVISCFILFVISAFLQIHVFTARYLLYLLIPAFIVSVIGLSKKLNRKHFIGFVLFFVLSAAFFNIKDFKQNKDLKTLAFKSVQIEAQNLKLTPYDIVIMPFGSDAPYYFRKLSDPQIFEFDFHKQARNPENINFYSPEQINEIKTSGKYKAVFDMISNPHEVAATQYEYFKKNVSDKVDRGNYAIVALYGHDANSIISDWTGLQSTVKDIGYVRKNLVELLFTKYIYDLRICLEHDFNFITIYPKENYTYIIYQKR